MGVSIQSCSCNGCVVNRTPDYAIARWAYVVMPQPKALMCDVATRMIHMSAFPGSPRVLHAASAQYDVAMRALQLQGLVEETTDASGRGWLLARVGVSRCAQGDAQWVAHSLFPFCHVWPRVHALADATSWETINSAAQ